MLKKIYKIIIVVAVVLLIGLGTYLYFNNLKEPKETPEENILENINQTAEQITEQTTKGVLPSIQTNPLEDKPDVNPANTNPIKDIKTNPFE